MNESTKYRVIFSGEIADGFTKENVKSGMASLFTMEMKKVEELLFKKFPVVVNDGLDQTTAMEYQTELAKIGAIVTVEEENIVQQSSHPIDNSPKSRTPGIPDEWSRVLNAFTGPIEPVPVKPTYFFGLCIVALIMIILPVVYILFIIFTGYLTYVHAAENYNAFGINSTRIRLLFYFGPLLAGITVLLFMIKPLFAKHEENSTSVTLSPQKEKFLFFFVRKICDLVRAPVPVRIDADNEVNASASFQRGFASFKSSDLVLTIGLPLVTGLSLKQFAGVLAHEFGHFSQGAGMRLSHIIRTINFWFLRVVYERDIFDLKLIEWSEDSNISYWRIPIIVARFSVWLSRRFLWVLMKIGQFFSGYLSREMEFDADRYETRMAGSKTFESTANQLHLIAEAAQRANGTIEKSLSLGRIPSSYSEYVVHQFNNLPPHTISAVKKRVLMGFTGLFDTHPTDRERINNAKAENAGGIFLLDEPATVLFSDFATLSQNLTVKLYRDAFGESFSKDQLVSNRDFVGDPVEEKSSQ